MPALAQTPGNSADLIVNLRSNGMCTNHVPSGPTAIIQRTMNNLVNLRPREVHLLMRLAPVGMRLRACPPELPGVGG